VVRSSVGTARECPRPFPRPRGRGRCGGRRPGGVGGAAAVVGGRTGEGARPGGGNGRADSRRRGPIPLRTVRRGDRGGAGVARGRGRGDPGEVRPRVARRTTTADLMAAPRRGRFGGDRPARSPPLPRTVRGGVAAVQRPLRRPRPV